MYIIVDMQRIPALPEAQQQFGTEITGTQIKDFERRTQIPVPEFIRNVPVITPTEAYDFAVSYLPVPDYTDEYKFLNATTGLRDIREYGGTVEAAQEWLTSPVINLVELSSNFERGVFNRDEIALHEKERRAKRDEQILTLEASLLRKNHGIEVSAKSLTEYSEWIAELLKNPEDAKAYYAHILGHYNPMTSALLRSFNPVKEWMDYFDGSYDIGFHWNLNRSDKGNIDFYSSFVVDGQVQTFGSSSDMEESGLVTHTTTVYHLDNIWKGLKLGGSQIGRVCFSDGRFTASSRGLSMSTEGKVIWEAPEEVAFVFDKKTIQGTYTALPMVEPLTGHENEVRTYEQVDPRLALALVPVTPELFPSFQGNAYGKMTVGAIEMKIMQVRYKETGELFSDAEKIIINQLLERIQKNSYSQ